MARSRAWWTGLLASATRRPRTTTRPTFSVCLLGSPVHSRPKPIELINRRAVALLVDNDEVKAKCIEAYEKSAVAAPDHSKAELVATDMLVQSVQWKFFFRLIAFLLLSKRQDVALIHGTEDDDSSRIWEATWAQQFWILSKRG